MSRLEEFINENRNAFDDAAPSDKVWQGIENAMKPAAEAKVVPMFSKKMKWSMVAATVVLFTGIAIFLMMETKQSSQAGATASKQIDSSNSSVDLATTDPEAAPEVNQFARLIALKQDELKRLSAAQPELYRKFSEDINQLDSTYINLNKQLSAAPNKEVLIEAMIQNLQLQLQVLNRQLTIINQIKNSKNDGHEKNEIYL